MCRCPRSTVRPLIAPNRVSLLDRRGVSADLRKGSCKVQDPFCKTAKASALCKISSAKRRRRAASCPTLPRNGGSVLHPAQRCRETAEACCILPNAAAKRRKRAASCPTLPRNGGGVLHLWERRHKTAKLCCTGSNASAKQRKHWTRAQARPRNGAGVLHRGQGLRETAEASCTWANASAKRRTRFSPSRDFRKTARLHGSAPCGSMIRGQRPASSKHLSRKAAIFSSPASVR